MAARHWLLTYVVHVPNKRAHDMEPGKGALTWACLAMLRTRPQPSQDALDVLSQQADISFLQQRREIPGRKRCHLTPLQELSIPGPCKQSGRGAVPVRTRS